MDTKEIVLTALVTMVLTGVGGQIFHASTTGKKVDELYLYMVESKAVLAEVRDRDEEEDIRTVQRIGRNERKISDMSTRVLRNELAIEVLQNSHKKNALILAQHKRKKVVKK